MATLPSPAVSDAPQSRILVIAADPLRRRAVRRALREAGFATLASASVEHAAGSPVRRCRWSLAVADTAGLPDAARWIEGFRALPGGTRMPLLVLAPRAEPDAVPRLLDAGADDCTAGIDAAEMIARVRALLRRADRRARQRRAILQLGRLRLDVAAHRLHANGVEVPLRPAEYRLIAWLLRRPHVAFTRDELAHVISPSAPIGPRAVDTQMCRLRAALAAADCSGYVQSVHGRGYRLSDVPGVRAPYGTRRRPRTSP